MEEIKRVSQWKPLVQPVLESKVSEFKLIGYKRANEEDIWNCLVQKVWKGDPEKKLYEVVAEIFHLNTGTFMNYITFRTYQDEDLMASIEALFHSET